MDSKPKRFALCVAAVLLSGAALYFGTGLHPVWWLMWLAPVPVLLAAPRLSKIGAFAAAFFAWAAGGFNTWHYLHGLLEMPLAIVLVIIVLPALLFGLDVLLYRKYARTSPWRAALLFPSFWVLMEFISERTSPHSTFGNISYSQMNFLPILQLASVTGIWGISFCLFLFAATLSIVIAGEGQLRERRILFVCVVATLALVIGFGRWRLDTTPASQASVTVGLIATDLRENILTEKPADTERLMQQYAGEAQKAAAQGAKVIVLPEKIGVLLNPDLPQFNALFQKTASQTGAIVIVGVIRPDPPNKWNEARIYWPEGTIRTYEKHHMLPAYESSFTVGTERTLWRQPSGLWGVAICKDMDFPALSRNYGNDGIGLLLVPAWDFNADGWLHGRMAILRGVESGFSMARAPKQGVLTVTDDRGRVLAERITNTAPFASLVASVPVRHTATLYARFGDWFAWLNVGLLCVLIGSALVSRRK